MRRSSSPQLSENIAPGSPRLPLEPVVPLVRRRGRPRAPIGAAVEKALIPLRRRLQDFVDVQTQLENDKLQLQTENEVR